MEKELPKNWVLTSLENVFNLYYGKGLPTNKLIIEGYNVYGANGIIGKFSEYLFENEKVIISCRGAASGAIHKTKPKSFVTSNSIILDAISPESINVDYTKYAMLNLGKEKVITGTAQPQITIKLLKDIQFPFVSLSEQTRIVAKLDRLFGQLDTIKASMEKIPVLLKNFRQQVLTQAVTGKLTEEWRRGKELKEWKILSVGEFMEEIKEKINPQKIPNTQYIGLEHLQKNGGIIAIGESEELKSNKTVFKKGDVLYGKLRPYLNKHDLVDFEGVCSTDILVYRNNDQNACQFFDYFLGIEPTIMKLNSEAKGINLPRVSAKILNQFIIQIPENKELNEIVTRVENLFSKADAIEVRYQSLKEKIDQLPQALLHKAFQGELVPQLESDGDARELLREIEALKKESKPKPAKRKPKRYQTNEVELGKAAEGGSKYKRS